MKIVSTKAESPEQPPVGQPDGSDESREQFRTEVREALAKLCEQHAQTCQALEVLGRLVIAVEKLTEKVDGMAEPEPEKPHARRSK
jgi:hypothetical protein